MKKPLFFGALGVILIALTATTIYAQVVAGATIVDKMKAAIHAFTLSAELNPGQTGYDSAPVAGKKTGNMLTAAEWNRMLELISQGATGGSGGGGIGLYKCTNAQSLDSTNAPCYGASRNSGAGTNQYRVLSCTDNDGIRSYTMSAILNFGELVANKWAVSINGGTIECDDGTILVMDIQSAGGTSTGSVQPPILCSKTANSGKAVGYRGGLNITFTAADCTGGVLPDTSNYIGVVQSVQVCGGIETFSVQGLIMKAYANNLCKWTSGKDYDFDVLYIHK